MTYVTQYYAHVKVNPGVGAGHPQDYDGGLSDHTGNTGNTNSF